ncbi:MAG TPA: ABC transporter permease [Trebonia sp.]|nr:ABC transporter permease [Trebonia sp.]
MSETAEQRSPAGAGLAPRPSGAGNGQFGGALRTGGRAFLRQREATVFVVAAALFIYFAVSSSSFVTGTNLPILFTQDSTPYIIIALGEVFLLICGEIDLSVGFTFTLAPFLMYFLNTYDHVPGLLAILIALLMGVAVGWVNAFLTITIGLPSFITTLGTGFVLLGIVNTTSHAEPVSIPPGMTGDVHWLGGNWAPFVWAVVLTLIMHIVLTRTRWGLHTVSVGGNILGAREAGIHVNTIKYGNFMLTGFFGALVGLQNAFVTNSIDPTAGGYQPMFYAVTAAVIGGTAMLGGTGTVIGAFLGAVVIGMLTDGFTILGVSANPLDIIFGAAVLIAMIANVWLARLRERGAQ